MASFLWDFIKSIHGLRGTNDTEKILDFGKFLVAMATKRKILFHKKIFKKSSTLKPLSLDLSYWVCSVNLWSSTIFDWCLWNQVSALRPYWTLVYAKNVMSENCHIKNGLFQNMCELKKLFQIECITRLIYRLSIRMHWKLQDFTEGFRFICCTCKSCDSTRIWRQKWRFHKTCVQNKLIHIVILVSFCQIVLHVSGMHILIQFTHHVWKKANVVRTLKYKLNKKSYWEFTSVSSYQS